MTTKVLEKGGNFLKGAEKEVNAIAN